MRVVAQGLPLEPDLRNSILYIWVGLELPGFILLMKELKSDMLAVESSPNGVNNLLGRSLELAHINCADMPDVASELSLHGMVYVENSKPLNL